jgi:hypothetical protein
MRKFLVRLIYIQELTFIDEKCQTKTDELSSRHFILDRHNSGLMIQVIVDIPDGFACAAHAVSSHPI